MSKKSYGQCWVCDDASIGINFGVPTCMPCKAFFRRNAVKLGTQEFVCQNDGDCCITYKNRRSCNCCRLAKCFRVGMNRSLILSDEKRTARNKLVASNRLQREKMIMPKQTTEETKTLSLVRMSSSSFQCLSSSDQVWLSNIFHAYENTCVAARNTRFQHFPVIQHTSIHTFLNEISPLYKTFVEFLKFIPEFTNLLIDDRIRLLRNHFGTITNINEHLMYSTTPYNLIVTLTNVFGTDIASRIFKRNKLIDQFIFDPILLKLVLIILVLSNSNNRNLHYTDMHILYENSLSIFHVQNVYVELLWRYILSRSSTEKDAIKFFNRLILCLLYVQQTDICIDTFICKSTREIQQMEPMMQGMWLGLDDEEKANDKTMNHGETPFFKDNVFNS